MTKLKVYTVALGILFVAIGGLMLYLNYSSVVTPTETESASANEIPQVYVGKPETLFEHQLVITALPSVNSYAECVEVTNLLYTSFPSKCIAPGGKVFVNSGFEQVTEIRKIEQVK